MTVTNPPSDERQPREQTIVEFFDHLGDQYDLAISRCVPRYHEMLDQMIGFLSKKNPIARILELGCGSGNLTQKLIDQYPAAEIVSVDASPKMISIVEAKFRQKPNVIFLESLFQDLQFASSSFDLITSSISIHHLKDSEKLKLFRNISGWLAPQGLFSFCDQFRGETEELYGSHLQFWQTEALKMGATQSEWETWMEHQRVHDFHASLQCHVDLLKDAGFKIVDCTRRHLLWTTLVAFGQPT